MTFWWRSPCGPSPDQSSLRPWRSQHESPIKRRIAKPQIKPQINKSRFKSSGIQLSGQRPLLRRKRVSREFSISHQVEAFRGLAREQHQQQLPNQLCTGPWSPIPLFVIGNVSLGVNEWLAKSKSDSGIKAALFRKTVIIVN